MMMMMTHTLAKEITSPFLPLFNNYNPLPLK
jgi:hypothetical protein